MTRIILPALVIAWVAGAAIRWWWGLVRLPIRPNMKEN